jgi:hypothetical protein
MGKPWEKMVKTGVFKAMDLGNHGRLRSDLHGFTYHPTVGI